MKQNNIEKDSKTVTLTPDQKLLFLQSLALSLERNGFSKSLKKFRSEAEIGKDASGISLIDLEEVYLKYLETSNHADSNTSEPKEQDVLVNGSSKTDGEVEFVDTVAKVKKNKKKKSDEKTEKSTDIKKSEESKPDVLLNEGSKTNGEVESVDTVAPVKKNKKKKSDDKTEKSTDIKKSEESKPDVLLNESSKTNGEVESVDTVATVKKYKKKKSDKKIEKSTDIKKSEDKPDDSVPMDVSLDKKSEKSTSNKRNDGLVSENLDSGDQDGKKVSKKRKSLDSEEKVSQAEDNNQGNGHKRRKKDGSEELKEAANSAKIDDSKAAEISKENPEADANGNVDKSGSKSAIGSSTKKHLSGSKEPKKPFQRVNVEEVEFFDERLQDNSYWAKGGADIGYGAKAQEVLGQVRGKGFRHEKTKKKRGSYRGGIIDQDSHSIKFADSD